MGDQILMTEQERRELELKEQKQQQKNVMDSCWFALAVLRDLPESERRVSDAARELIVRNLS